MKDVLYLVLWMKDGNQTLVIDKGRKKTFSSFLFITSTSCCKPAMAHFLAAKVPSRLDVWKGSARLALPYRFLTNNRQCNLSL
jgi:hypothetical protein